MSLTFNSFVVAGAGRIGAVIAASLLATGAKVTVFTRGGNSKIPAGASVQKVIDYTNTEELVAYLRDAGAEVVVSTLSGVDVGLPLQIPLADAAKLAGVKLFVPSEFGNRTLETPPGLLDIKATVVGHLKFIGLPYTVYYTGLFSDLPLDNVPNVLDIKGRTVTAIGSSDTKITFTAMPDIGYFVAYTLTRLPVSQLENAVLGVEGSKLTWKEVAQAFEKKYGEPFEVRVRDADEVMKGIDEHGAKAYGDYVFWMAGAGYLDIKEYNRTDLVPGWTPKSYEEVIQTVYT